MQQISSTRRKLAFISQPENFRFIYEHDLDEFVNVREFKFTYSMAAGQFSELLNFMHSDGLKLSGEFAFPVATDVYKPLDVPKEWDIFFIGRSTAHRERFFEPLKHYYNFLHIAHGVWGAGTEEIDQSYMQRFQVIPNGVYIHEFDNKVIHARYKNFTIGYVGRFASEKRPELFLELSKTNYDFQCSAKMITDKFEALDFSYPSLNLVLGISDSARVRKEFSAISVLVITSVREGFPLVIMEAMELGIPVISTNVGSIQEYVINGFNGYVSDVCDHESFLSFCRQKIELLGKDEKLYTDFCMNARHHAVTHFNIENMHKAYKKLFLDE